MLGWPFYSLHPVLEGIQTAYFGRIATKVRAPQDFIIRRLSNSRFWAHCHKIESASKFNDKKVF